MISIIASVGKNFELGKNNELIWHISSDMKFFRNTTMGHKVIMGRKTYESLPGKLLGREMIVISTTMVDNNVYIEPSINSIVDKYKDSLEEVFIIGGAKIYSQFIGYASKLYLTEIKAGCIDADSYFPTFDKNDWNREIVDSGIDKNIRYEICIYKKKIM